MKKMIFAIATMFMCVNVNAASAKAASEKIQQIRTEQSILQDQAIASDPVTAMQIMKGVILLDSEIEKLIPSLLAERETLRNEALDCGNDVVAAMEITKKVIFIDVLLEELGYEEPYDDDCVDE